MIQFQSTGDFKEYLSNEVVTSGEVKDELNITNVELTSLVNNNTIIPFKRMGEVSLFLKEDLEKVKK